jgi:adenylate cyclase
MNLPKPAGARVIPQGAARRLPAISAGYSRLIGSDEGGTLARLKAIQAELIDPTIAAHNGRLVKTTGDGLLAPVWSNATVICRD